MCNGSGDGIRDVNIEDSAAERVWTDGMLFYKRWRYKA